MGMEYTCNRWEWIEATWMVSPKFRAQLNGNSSSAGEMSERVKVLALRPDGVA